MKKCILILVAAIFMVLLASHAFAQDISGYWYVAVTVNSCHYNGAGNFSQIDDLTAGIERLILTSGPGYCYSDLDIAKFCDLDEFPDIYCDWELLGDGCSGDAYGSFAPSGDYASGNLEGCYYGSWEIARDCFRVGQLTYCTCTPEFCPISDGKVYIPSPAGLD